MPFPQAQPAEIQFVAGKSGDCGCGELGVCADLAETSHLPATTGPAEKQEQLGMTETINIR